jgi:hypothetical protein
VNMFPLVLSFDSEMSTFENGKGIIFDVSKSAFRRGESINQSIHLFFFFFFLFFKYAVRYPHYLTQSLLHRTAIFIHDRSWLTALHNHNFEVQSLLLRHNDRVRRGEYNREFGLHSTFKFGGSGLSDYRNQDNVGVFTGTIHLLKVVSNNMQTIIIADRSGSLEVVTGENIRKLLKNMIQTTDSSQFDSSRRFLSSIRSFKSVGDDKVFVLTNLAPCD